MVAVGEQVQEITEKAPALPAELRWHFIGKLQSNKAKKLVTAVPNLACVETVDTVKLAKMLDKACAAAERAEPLRVFVQVNTTDEPQKNGTTIDGALDVALHIHKECENLAFAGLMTVGKLGEPAPIYFERLVECRSSVCAALGLDVESVELSMGMSADFEDAIAAGSTNVRVGSSIFGARDPKKVAERRAESAKADDATAGDSPSGAGGAGGAAGAATDGKE